GCQWPRRCCRGCMARLRRPRRGAAVGAGTAGAESDTVAAGMVAAGSSQALADMAAAEADTVAAGMVAADTSQALADMAAGLAGTAAVPSVRRILAGRASAAHVLRLIQSEVAVSP